MPKNISPGDEEFSFEEFEQGFVFDSLDPFGEKYKKTPENQPADAKDKAESVKPVNRITKYFK
ncbi:hypothetical protein HY837_06805 [archaeon]|nr:hypothetical protein [archaeon]